MAIIKAAARILVSQGRDRLTTNAIADRADTSVGALYQHRPNKELIHAARWLVAR